MNDKQSTTEKQKSQSPEFISLDEAAQMKDGTRVTFVPGVQALYAEALKNICYVKKYLLSEFYIRLWESIRKPVRTDKRSCLI